MIDLPEDPAPQGADAALVDFGAFLTPSLGGPVQRVERMGTRFRISVNLPPMFHEPEQNGPDAGQSGRKWLSALVRGKQEGARMPFPMLGFDPGTPGTVLVNGADQSGRTLIVDGATPNYPFRDGQFFSVETGGQHFLHMVVEEAFASAGGGATLSIEPMLRRSPTDNSPCHFGKPMIEGFIMGDEMMWNIALANLVGLSFDLVERE